MPAYLIKRDCHLLTKSLPDKGYNKFIPLIFQDQSLFSTSHLVHDQINQDLKKIKKNSYFNSS
jgi:hypothetical protein